MKNIYLKYKSILVELTSNLQKSENNTKLASLVMKIAEENILKDFKFYNEIAVYYTLDSKKTFDSELKNIITQSQEKLKTIHSLI